MSAPYVYRGVRNIEGRDEHQFLLDEDVFTRDKHVVIRAVQWCEKNICFQHTQVIADLDWYVNMGDIYIVDADHAFAFRMRWC